MKKALLLTFTILAVSTLVYMGVGLNRVTATPPATRTVDCTGTDPNADFESIQDAVNASSPGDIIEVAPVTCVENVLLDKRLTIIGAGDGNASYPVGTTIVQANDPNLPVIEIDIDQNNLTVPDPNWNASNRLLIKNLNLTGATGPAASGIWYGKMAVNPLLPTTLDFATFENISAFGNRIGFEAYASFINDLIIKDSSFSDNTDVGFKLTAFVEKTERVNILGSHFDRNGNGGLSTGNSEGIQNNWIIQHSTFNENQGIGFGLEMTNGDVICPTIDDSEFNRNRVVGLFLGANFDHQVTNVRITNSKFNDNGSYGFRLIAYPEPFGDSTRDGKVRNVSVDCSEFFRNGFTGYMPGSDCLDADGNPTAFCAVGEFCDLTVHNTNFADNGPGGALFNNSTEVTVDASNNWWGAADGPDCTGVIFLAANSCGPEADTTCSLDTTGSGDKIFGHIKFRPFLESPSTKVCIALVDTTIECPCLGEGGGRTPGFWSNKNGEAAMNACEGGMKGTLSFLRSLNLRNADGSHFDPKNYPQFRDWLLAGEATNMAYMLSVHLASMSLNVRCLGVDGNALIFAPGTNSANGTGFATINAILTEANNSLGLYGFTPSGHPQRRHQELLKNALDNANNDETFLVPCPNGASPSPTPTPSPTPEASPTPESAPASTCNLSATSVAFKDKQVKTKITNKGSTRVTLSDLSLGWPQTTNGKLKSVKFNNDVLYSGSLSSPASISQLISDVSKKSIDPGKTRELILEFEKKVSTTKSQYSGSINFGSGCSISFPP